MPTNRRADSVYKSGVSVDRSGSQIDSNKNTTTTNTLERIQNSTPLSSKEFDFPSYLTVMIENKKKHISLIGKYFKKRGLVFETKGQIGVAIRRHLRAATQLAEFSDSKIKEAVKTVEEKYPNVDWTLETLVKILTK